MISMEVKGLADLERKLRALDAKLAGKVLTTAARKSFKPVLETARRLAPKDTGLLQKRIKVASGKDKDRNFVVGLRLGNKPATLNRSKKKAAKKSGKTLKAEPRNWAWYERGIPSRGIPPKPFLRPALDKNASAVIERLKVELASAIERVQ